MGLLRQLAFHHALILQRKVLAQQARGDLLLVEVIEQRRHTLGDTRVRPVVADTVRQAEMQVD
ncbi:hypothetical protein D3C75_1345850 [compost metagenome]